MLVLSLVLGGIGVFYSKHYIEEQIAHYKAQLERSEPMVKVVVAGRAMERGEVITQADLLQRPIPVQYADSNSVTAANVSVALGQQLDSDVDEGRPILWAHLEGGLSPTFSGKVPEGLRAITIRVDEINSISGFLQPKDRVDLLLGHGSGERYRIVPLIERLEIIATGVQTLVDKSREGATRQFSTITVQVTPEQAQRITLAQQIGKLTATLRNPDDEAPLGDAEMDVAKLLNLPAAPAPSQRRTPAPRAPAPASPGIEYIIGGS